jgi:hypothetical protein
MMPCIGRCAARASMRIQRVLNDAGRPRAQRMEEAVRQHRGRVRF